MLLCTTYEFFQLMYLKPPALICYCNSAVHYLLAEMAISFKNFQL
jgi:hypothetical protein